MLNLNNWVNDWSCLEAQTAWHYNTINHECNQNKWVKSSCHSSSQHKIYVFTKLHLTIQINLQWWHTTFLLSPFWKAGETGPADWRKSLGGLKQGCYFFFIYTGHVSPSEEKVFHASIPQRQFVHLLAWGRQCTLLAFRNAKNAKSHFNLPEVEILAIYSHNITSAGWS